MFDIGYLKFETINLKSNMKAMYSKPEIEIMQVGTCSILQDVSGGGLHYGGADNGENGAQAPGRRPF